MGRPRWYTVERRRVLRRGFKVALAATISTFIAQQLDLPVPWFATISAIVAMEVTLQVSLRSSRNAVVGAVVGAAGGLAMATVAKDQVWAVGLVVLVSLVVFGLANLGQVGRQAALVASVIVLIPASTGLSTPEFALVRLVETLIGIVVALVVNATVLPPRAYRGARRNLGLTYVHLAEMYRLVVAAEATGERDAAAIVAARRGFRTCVRQVDDLWDEAMSEHPAQEVLSPHWRATTRRIWEQCAAMDDAVMDASARGQLRGARAELTALADGTAAALDQVASTLAGDGPVPPFRQLESARGALLDRVRALEVHAFDLSYTEALQAFTFVNSMTVIAARLAELAVDDPTTAASPDTGAPDGGTTDPGTTDAGPAGPRGSGRS